VYAQEKADNRLASFSQDRGVYFRIKNPPPQHHPPL
jgi:hypothetical protein